VPPFSLLHDMPLLSTFVVKICSRDFLGQKFLVGHFSLGKTYFGEELYDYCNIKIKFICEKDKIFLNEESTFNAT